MTTATPSAPSQREVNPWVVLIVLCSGFFMIMLDSTIVNVALPAMLDGLDGSLDQILWVINAYLLAYATLLITGGRLGDIFGPRNLFITGLSVFVLASIACGVSQNTTQMIIARVVQGLAGALLTPQTLTIITAVFPKERRGAAMGVWSALIGMSAIAGPIIGGVLVDGVNWRWIFFVNVPIGAVGLWGAFRFVPDLRPGRSHRLDLPGVLLVSASLSLIVYGLIEGERYDWGECWGPITIWEIIGAGVVLLIAFVVYERRPSEPLLPLALIRNRNFAVLNWLQALIAFGLMALYLPVVLFLQSVLDMSAIRAGLTMAPWAVATMFTAPFAGRLADKYGAKWVLMLGLALFSLGVGLMIAAVDLDAGFLSFLLPGFVAGGGLGLSMAPLTAEALREVPPVQVGAASGMLNAVRQVGSVIGTAVVGAVLQAQLSSSFASQARDRVAGVDAPAEVKTQLIDAFSEASDSGLQVAPGQNGGVALPDGVAPDTASTLEQVAHDVFVNGFTDAVKPTLAVPVVVLAVAALSCLAIARRRAAAEVTPAPAAAPDKAPAAAD
ncbi:DHA2 family efflux MFS transporter permease subunit [Streptomyces hoynatensis]|uniref:DHA2 family efflux MFS transporter permease subunit n=1 Tax=Streptomyces hoynatensis TaxID=1141874 RepID=UPI00131A47DA|nr:DHA2 family efflux MFS transporter permease subunit [Streptomyces hoynatensis]